MHTHLRERSVQVWVGCLRTNDDGEELGEWGWGRHLSTEARGLRTFHLGGLTGARWHPEKIRKQASAGRNWWSNTPDGGAILNLLLQSKYFDPASCFISYTCLCTPCCTCTNFFLFLRLAKLIPTSGPVYTLLCPPRMPPLPYPICAWLVCLQSGLSQTSLLSIPSEAALSQTSCFSVITLFSCLCSLNPNYFVCFLLAYLEPSDCNVSTVRIGLFFCLNDHYIPTA